MWYVCDVLYVVLYVRGSCFVVRGSCFVMRGSCFVVRGCAVSRRYIDVSNCDMFNNIIIIFILSPISNVYKDTSSVDL